MVSRYDGESDITDKDGDSNRSELSGWSQDMMVGVTSLIRMGILTDQNSQGGLEI